MEKGKHSAELFCLGGLGYAVIEILWRGFTHWTMFLTGGLVFVGLSVIEENMSDKFLPVRWLIGACFVTMAELLVGISVNIFLKLNVWDYSDEWGNIYGQICPKYTFYWFLICIVAMPAAYMTTKQLAYYRKARYNKSYGKKPKKGFGIYAYCFRHRKQSCENRSSLRGRNSICRLDSDRRENDKRAICMSDSRGLTALQCQHKQNQGCGALFSGSSSDNGSAASYKYANGDNASKCCIGSQNRSEN